ncbi:MAG: hypothetical protein Q9187_001770 [Circinaria calcarea]
MSLWPLLGQLDPPTGFYDLPTPGPLLDSLTGTPAKGRNGKQLRDFPFLPREFTCSVMDMDPRDVEVYFRMHPALSYDDLGSRQPAGCPELTYNLTNQMNNRRLRQARKPYNARVWRKNGGQPAKVLIEQVENLTDDMLKKNCNWKITARGIQHPDDPNVFLHLDSFLENGVEHTPHDDVLNALAESRRLKALATSQGYGHWKEVPMKKSSDGVPQKWLGRHVKGKKRKSDDLDATEEEDSDNGKTKSKKSKLEVKLKVPHSNTGKGYFKTSRIAWGCSRGSKPKSTSFVPNAVNTPRIDLVDRSHNSDEHLYDNREPLSHNSKDGEVTDELQTAESVDFPQSSITKRNHPAYFSESSRSIPARPTGYVSGGTVKGWGQRDIWCRGPVGNSQYAPVGDKDGFQSVHPDPPHYQKQLREAEITASNPRKRPMVIDDHVEMESRKRSRVDASTSSSSITPRSADLYQLASPDTSTFVQAASAPGHRLKKAVYPPYTEADNQCSTASSLGDVSLNPPLSALLYSNSSANRTLLDQGRYDPVLAFHPSIGKATLTNETNRIPTSRNDLYMDMKAQKMDPRNAFGVIEPHILPNTDPNPQLPAAQTYIGLPYYNVASIGIDTSAELPSFANAYAGEPVSASTSPTSQSSPAPVPTQPILESHTRVPPYVPDLYGSNPSTFLGYADRPQDLHGEGSGWDPSSEALLPASPSRTIPPLQTLSPTYTSPPSDLQFDDQNTTFALGDFAPQGLDYDEDDDFLNNVRANRIIPPFDPQANSPDTTFALEDISLPTLDDDDLEFLRNIPVEVLDNWAESIEPEFMR